MFSEQSPLAFAQAYVEHVQDGASKDIYGQFLHSDAREKLDSGSAMMEFMYQSAPRENAEIAERGVLSEGPKSRSAKAARKFLYGFILTKKLISHPYIRTRPSLMRGTS